MVVMVVFAMTMGDGDCDGGSGNTLTEVYNNLGIVRIDIALYIGNDEDVGKRGRRIEDDGSTMDFKGSVKDIDIEIKKKKVSLSGSEDDEEEFQDRRLRRLRIVRGCCCISAGVGIGTGTGTGTPLLLLLLLLSLLGTAGGRNGGSVTQRISSGLTGGASR
ncbi:hypothetical protein M0804_008071 [Polistes exclamans]|nr:hypothetical protein M0804_008071 [Polistes exclamans]